ncbi:MAG: hypothetical protein Ct9H90mP3_2030 [Flammeovirgaceae bacterium]|nr:MAG: hypothetical protein Ct9H90mP3_2030 [Flammeovirgaceae bacterium]
MNKIKLLLVLIILLSCSDNNENISGNTGLFYQTTFFDGLSRD